MDRFEIKIPELCLVALVGGSSSGKTSFAHRHFAPTEVLSSDYFRGMVCDDELDQSVSADAFDLLYRVAEKRLEHGKLTVVDATNLQQKARDAVLRVAREKDVHAAAIVFDLPEKLLQERNASRSDRNFPQSVIRKHCRELKSCIRSLKREGFRFIYVLDSVEKAERAEIIREKLWNDKRDDRGPFDIIGDVHGCCTELEMLLDKLGYVRRDGVYAHPDGRRAAFLGDFCDRGPRNADVLRLVTDMVGAGNAVAVPGNHDIKLLRYLNGRNIERTHGIDKTIEELEARGEPFKSEVARFIDGLIGYYVFDGGRLAIAHAGIKEQYIGRSSGRVRDFCIYGERTGETDGYGLPVRLDWTDDYRGKTTVVYGHIAGEEVRAHNGTYCIDTGCVFGGKLTAYRYPEREIVSVDALERYCEPIKPLRDESDKDIGDVLTACDFNGKMYVETSLAQSVAIPENNSAAALETMSRYAADPHWLVYLPPTMSPCETSELDDYLEHPLQAFSYFRENGVRNVVCERKHMGSRAVVVLCRSREVALRRFGAADGRGIIYTRTGRRFFDRQDLETEILDRLDAVLDKTGFWRDLDTDWAVFDTELMPWSDKARSLIASQYAPTGDAGLMGLNAAVDALRLACGRKSHAPQTDPLASGQNVEPAELLSRYERKLDDIERYIAAYREYCGRVESVDDYRIAPFHILACEGKTFTDEKHVWHMENVKKYIAGVDPVFIETPYICVDVDDEASVARAVDWWLELTASGGEGMVVKPEAFTARNNGRLLQPAVKCRGREYLRIIYGAEYLSPENLQRLKKRSLSRKRALALKEFALGAEGLKRFVEGAPLYRVHECAFGVLALESEPVDPRL